MHAPDGVSVRYGCACRCSDGEPNYQVWLLMHTLMVDQVVTAIT